MTKFRGSIGIDRGSVETSPGIFEPNIEEVEITGEMRNLSARWQSHEQRDSVSARHVLSIVTPENSIIDFSEVVYIIWQMRKWSVVSIEYKRPRIELALGGLYNG
jgi:hypothetical protein